MQLPAAPITGRARHWSTAPDQRVLPKRRAVVASRLSGNATFAELLCRIRAEYLEMPGLQLTVPQVRCLFGLDAETGDAVLAALVDAQFLCQTHKGVFAIAGNKGVVTGRTARVGVDRT